MRKIFNFIFLFIIFILVILLLAIVYKYNYIVNSNGASVADGYKKVEIWGSTVYGNSPISKLPKMNIDEELGFIQSAINYGFGIVGDEYEDREQVMDTFTYNYEIKGGYEKETFEDRPYLIPYLVESGDVAVIIVSGGGFGYKSIDGENKEGKDVAISLNKAGINAFVLHYRSNPYEYPIPMIDLQRAIKYLKYNSSEYKINPDKINLLGYSAGGFTVCDFLNKKDIVLENYNKDYVDEMDDSVRTASYIYGMFTFRKNVPMLFTLFDSDSVKDFDKREELLNRTDLYNFISSVNIPQFVAYGTRDLVVGDEGAKEYISKLQMLGGDIKEVVAKDQDHSFSQDYYMNEYIKWLFEKNK